MALNGAYPEISGEAKGAYAKQQQRRQIRIYRIYIAIYTIGKGVAVMEIAKIFENGRSQAVRLSMKFRLPGDEVFIQRLGDAVILTPKEKAWQTFLNGLEAFSEDFMEGGREPEIPTARDTL